MSFRKVTVVLSGNGVTGLVKLSGSFDGVGKIKGECGALPAEAGELYIIGDEIAKVRLEQSKRTFETRLLALSDISCLLRSGDYVLTGGTGDKVDRRAVERRVAAFERKAVKSEGSSARTTSPPVAEPPRSDVGGRDKVFPADDGTATETPSHKTDAESLPFTEGNGGGGNDAGCDDEGQRQYNRPSAKAAGEADVNVRSVLEEGVTYDGTNFFLAVKPQLDEMFVRYPAEERLNTIVPNSKWVRVDTEDGDYYVLGVLYDLSTPIFICYGIPGIRTVAPPREIADVCVWLPLSSDKPDGNGFWIIYQSAENGKCVR